MGGSPTGRGKRSRSRRLRPQRKRRGAEGAGRRRRKESGGASAVPTVPRRCASCRWGGAGPWAASWRGRGAGPPCGPRLPPLRRRRRARVGRRRPAPRAVLRRGAAAAASSNNSSSSSSGNRSSGGGGGDRDGQSDGQLLSPGRAGVGLRLSHVARGRSLWRPPPPPPPPPPLLPPSPRRPRTRHWGWGRQVRVMVAPEAAGGAGN